MEPSAPNHAVSDVRVAKKIGGTSCPLSAVGSWERVAIAASFRPVDMAARCGISLRQLERVFIERFHTTPKSWARKLRCNLARDLLAKGWTNKAVAQELRFSDASHLCHEFRLEFGATPRDLASSLNTSRRENYDRTGQLFLQLRG